MKQLKALENVLAELEKLPAIGRKSARRIAFYLLKQPPARAARLAAALEALHREIRPCSRCFNLAESEVCAVCDDPTRESTICVVEDVGDVMALESTGEYHGLYHVLGGVIAPLDGIGPNDLTIDVLIRRVNGEKPAGIILATGFTVEGEATALYVARLLKPLDVKVYRLAYGLPVGSTLEHADEATVVRALEGKIEL
ncbi:recombination protein RecR [bacterium]|nr:recombination protein RecR [candidate division CSSED10-310 bacterium]